MDNELARRLETRIEHKAKELGYELGWRLLASPASVLNESEVAFIGLNPGGRTDTAEHPRFAPDEGSAYVTESWAGHPPGTSPLQKQVRCLFARLDVVPQAVLAGNLVPFRSPSWKELPKKHEALTFGRCTWREIIDEAQPKLIITMSRLVFGNLSSMLSMGNVRKEPSCWGNISLRYCQGAERLLVGLPHLSRFPLLGRCKSEPWLARVFSGYWKGHPSPIHAE